MCVGRSRGGEELDHLFKESENREERIGKWIDFVSSFKSVSANMIFINITDIYLAMRV